MMRKFLFFVLIALYLPVAVLIGADLKNRPVEVKLGYVPEGRLLKYLPRDQQPMISQWFILKVIFYFGTVIDHWFQQDMVQPEYYTMFKTVETAVILDPYNMDAYYFAQAAFTWELGRARDVNRLLIYGMKYRTWDYWLPFYVGFNNAYFLHDYTEAAFYMQKAAEISGNSMYTNLAARFYYEAGDSRLGVAFLDNMINQAKDPKVKRLYELRKVALQDVEKIETALRRYKKFYGLPPKDISRLVDLGFLPFIPQDPYGGTFFLDSLGQVRSTSKFVETTLNQEEMRSQTDGE